jgi:hypothetical protein
MKMVSRADPGVSSAGWPAKQFHGIAR